jgi:hypothetical protein
MGRQVQIEHLDGAITLKLDNGQVFNVAIAEVAT